MILYDSGHSSRRMVENVDDALMSGKRLNVLCKVHFVQDESAVCVFVRYVSQRRGGRGAGQRVIYLCIGVRRWLDAS